MPRDGAVTRELTPGRLLGQERHVGGLGRALPGRARQQLLVADKARGILEVRHYSLKMSEKGTPEAVSSEPVLRRKLCAAPCSWPADARWDESAVRVLEP